jgi:hypothetical protein
MGFNKTPHLTFAPKNLEKLPLQRPGLGILEWGLIFFKGNVLISRILLAWWFYECLCLDFNLA